jgi:hypothetical protein
MIDLAKHIQKVSGIWVKWNTNWFLYFVKIIFFNFN